MMYQRTSPRQSRKLHFHAVNESCLNISSYLIHLQSVITLIQLQSDITLTQLQSDITLIQLQSDIRDDLQYFMLVACVCCCFLEGGGGRPFFEAAVIQVCVMIAFVLLL